MIDPLIEIDGEKYPLRVSLGALAALEDRLGEGNLETLERRLFAPTAADILEILRVLSAGAGRPIPETTLQTGRLSVAMAAEAISRAFVAGMAGEKSAKAEAAAAPTPPEKR
ncbi:MAG: GTA-gp10 family protein [Pseudomonadota bacterium]